MKEILDRKVVDPIMPVLKQMAVGDTHQWDLSRVNVVRPVIKQTSYQTGRIFTTNTREVRGKVTVKRIK